MQYSEKTRTQSSSKPFNDTWIKSTWRPAMAIVYMIICLYDFVFADVLRMYLITSGLVDPALVASWVAQTLSNGGVFHLSMGVILGASAWTRGQEKIRRVETYGNNQFSDPFFNTSSRTNILSQSDIMNDPSVIPPVTGN